MARDPRTPIVSKKHLARLERERIQNRYIVWGGIIVVALVVLLLGYGVLDANVIKPRQPVAVVNGEGIPSDLWQSQVRYGRYSMIREAMNTAQFLQMFGNDPSTLASFGGQLVQYKSQLDQPASVGKSVLDQMVDAELIRQEAQKRGITITQEEKEKAFQEAFGYFAEGTPTPEPTEAPVATSTLSALQATLAAQMTPSPTVTPTITETTGLTETETLTDTPPVTDTEALTETETLTETEPLTDTAAVTPDASEALTPTATLAPTPSPTPYTLEGYQKLLDETVQNLNSQYGVDEADLRYIIETQLYREKVMESVLAETDLSRTQEQVWARHILVADEATALRVRERLDAGEDFCALAAELSTDESNKAQCGDLQWFSRERMVEPFANAAFELEVGEVSQPVQTDFGWHIIQVLGHEDKPLDENTYQQLRQTRFEEWLSGQREAANIEIRDFWTERVPSEPALPVELEQLIQQIQAAQQVQPESQIPGLDVPPVEEAPVEPTPAE